MVGEPRRSYGLLFYLDIISSILFMQRWVHFFVPLVKHNSEIVDLFFFFPISNLQRLKSELGMKSV